MSRVDLLELARKLPRDAFLEQCPHHLLVGKMVLEAPRTPRRTELLLDMGEMTTLGDLSDEPSVTRDIPRGEPQKPHAQLVVLPVRKVQSTFPSMITVGRTANNDIVITDVNISRFHAYFRVLPDHVEVADAGSANGTFVAGQRLPPKGAAQPIASGTTVAFAQLEFAFLDASSAWDRLRRG